MAKNQEISEVKEGLLLRTKDVSLVSFCHLPSKIRSFQLPQSLSVDEN